MERTTGGAGTLMSPMWKALSNEDKKVYEDMAKLDRERYHKEMAEYKPPAPPRVRSTGHLHGPSFKEEISSSDDEAPGSDGGAPHSTFQPAACTTCCVFVWFSSQRPWCSCGCDCGQGRECPHATGRRPASDQSGRSQGLATA